MTIDLQRIVSNYFRNDPGRNIDQFAIKSYEIVLHESPNQLRPITDTGNLIIPPLKSHTGSGSEKDLTGVPVDIPEYYSTQVKALGNAQKKCL